MKKLLCLLVLISSGVAAQNAGNVTVIFDPAFADKTVKWAEGDFLEPKEGEATDTLILPTYNGFVELVFIRGTETEAKFLLQAGDTVKFYPDESGYPLVTSLADPLRDEVYNFPAHVGGVTLSPDTFLFDKMRTQRGMPSFITSEKWAQFDNYRKEFMAKLAESEMTGEYERYYKDGYFALAEPVLNDALVPYFSNRQWLAYYNDTAIFELMKAGRGNIEKGQISRLFDSLANADIPPLSKAIILRELLRTGFQSFEGPETQQEYAAKYIALTGDESMMPNAREYDKEEVQLEDTAGNAETLSGFLARHKGKVIYVDFWASWCGPCLQAMPVAAKLRAKRPDVVYLYLSIDSDRKSWLAAHQKLNLPNSYRIVNHASSKLLNELDIKFIPHCIIIGRNGNIVERNAPGPRDVERLFDKY